MTDHSEIAALAAQVDGLLARSAYVRELQEPTRRCDRTHHLCGTDTRPKGQPCPCASCQAWLCEELDRRFAVCQAAQRVLDEYKRPGASTVHWGMSDALGLLREALAALAPEG